jgi:hypothetical protein
LSCSKFGTICIFRKLIKSIILSPRKFKLILQFFYRSQYAVEFKLGYSVVTATNHTNGRTNTALLLCVCLKNPQNIRRWRGKVFAFPCEQYIGRQSSSFNVKGNVNALLFGTQLICSQLTCIIVYHRHTEMSVYLIIKLSSWVI